MLGRHIRASWLLRGHLILKLINKLWQELSKIEFTVTLPLMLSQDTFSGVSFFATLDGTLVGFVTSVDAEMSLQNSLLVEGLRAAVNWALEYFLTCLKIDFNQFRIKLREFLYE
jgi:hypothetical protein